MISRFLSWLFGASSSGHGSNWDPDGEKEGGGEPRVPSAAPAESAANGESLKSIRDGSPPIAREMPAGEIRAKKSVEQKLPSGPVAKPPTNEPLDLDIGLDVGTACSKAVIGNRELNEHTAVPINGGRNLAGYLLPSRVYLDAGSYSLVGTPGAVTRTNLKIRLIHAGIRATHPSEAGPIHDLVAFTALTLRRILEWHSEKLAPNQFGRVVSWNLNVGLPSKGNANDPFESIYRQIVGAAVILAPGKSPITQELITATLAQPRDADWLPHGHIHYYPEAAAQLASLVFSPHCPAGCLLVVDVGAGTLDVSTIRIGRNATEAQCNFNFCEVAPLGVHFLHLARSGQVARNLDHAAFSRLIETIPNDDGDGAMSGKRAALPPAHFHEHCKEVIMKNVVRYRRHLQNKHVKKRGFMPWTDGLPYVLSGGGCRDPYYQKLLNADLPQWLETVCSEWQSFSGMPKRGLQLRSFPAPKAFAPRVLATDFDRFSVAHGLSLGVENLMRVSQTRID